jgi:hypothetical protein
MAKADMTKIDKAEATKIDKAEAAKIDKAEMAKIDFDAMSIEELAMLRDNASAKLLEKVTARQIELEAEIERLSQYGKQSKKAVATTAVTKPKKGHAKADDASNPVADASATDTPVAAAA